MFVKTRTTSAKHTLVDDTRLNLTHKGKTFFEYDLSNRVLNRDD